MISEDRVSNFWLSFGLAFVGGYGDAASFVLAYTFTGHITGAFVLTAISIAGHDWPTFYRRLTGIAFFLAGILLSVILERSVATRLSRFLLPSVMGIEIVLISTAYVALTSNLANGLGLFVSCMSLALGLQNGAWRRAGGISVHTTYLTGMVTDLVTTATERRFSSAAPRRESQPNPKVSLLCGTWLAFVFGAWTGATMVLRFQALGTLGAAVPLLAMMIFRSRTMSRIPS